MTPAKPSSTSVPPSPDVPADARAEPVIGSLADRPDGLVARVQWLPAR